MSVEIKADFARENMMRLLRNSIFGVLVLAAIAVALTPKAVLADKDKTVPIDGTFAVSYMYPSALDYCASPSTSAFAARRVNEKLEMSYLIAEFQGG